MRKATRGNQSELRKVEKREWWLWATAVTVTLLLTVGIASFLPPLLQAQETWETLFGIRQAVWGLLGAVLLFDLYSIHQQLQIQRIRRQLAEREELFRLISENAADMIAVVDLQGRRIYNSISYERVLGYSAEELKQSFAFEQIHPEDREAVRRAENEPRLTGSSKTVAIGLRKRLCVFSSLARMSLRNIPPLGCPSRWSIIMDPPSAPSSPFPAP